MKKNISIIIEDLIKELKKFLPAQETEKFIDLFQNVEQKISSTDTFSDENLYQIEKEVDSGSDIREQIDKLITFAEKRLSVIDYLLLSISVSELMINYGEFDYCEDIISDIQKRAREEDEPVILADVLLQQAKVEWNQGNWEKAKRACTKSEIIYSSVGNELGLAKCENLLGTIYGEKGDLDKAELHFKQGLEFQKYKSNDTLVLHLTNNLAIISTMRDDYKSAARYLKKALPAVKKLNDAKAEARINHNIASLKSKMGLHEEALDYYDNAINLSIEKGYLTNCAISFIGKAYSYAQNGNHQLSEAFIEKALEISYKINDRLSIADAYCVKGIIQKNLNNYDLSAEFFENSLRLNQDFKNELNQAETSVELAKLKKDKKKDEESGVLLNKAKKYYKKFNAIEKLKSIEETEKNV